MMLATIPQEIHYMHYFATKKKREVEIYSLRLKSKIMSTPYLLLSKIMSLVIMSLVMEQNQCMDFKV